MLETVDFSLAPLPKEEYRQRRDALMKRLVVLQQQARERGVGLVVLFEGWDGAGKGSRISDLMYHLDARATSVHVTENLDVEAARAFAGAEYGVTGFYPAMQQFWQALGMRGTITFYDRGWYTAATQLMLYTEYGELSLDGGLHAADGVMAMLSEGKRHGITRFIIPRENLQEALLQQKVYICAADNLREAVELLRQGEQAPRPV